MKEQVCTLRLSGKMGFKFILFIKHSETWAPQPLKPIFCAIAHSNHSDLHSVPPTHHNLSSLWALGRIVLFAWETSRPSYSSEKLLFIILSFKVPCPERFYLTPRCLCCGFLKLTAHFISYLLLLCIICNYSPEDYLIPRDSDSVVLVKAQAMVLKKNLTVWF